MEFFDFDTESTPGLKTTKIRFPGTFIAHVAGQPSALTVTPERYTRYDDGRELYDGLPQITAVLRDEDVGRTIDLYDPATGAVVGQFAIGQFIAMLYSVQIDVYNQNLAAIATTTRATAAGPASETI